MNMNVEYMMGMSPSKIFDLEATT